MIITYMISITTVMIGRVISLSSIVYDMLMCMAVVEGKNKEPNSTTAMHAGGCKHELCENVAPATPCAQYCRTGPQLPHRPIQMLVQLVRKQIPQKQTCFCRW